MLVNSFNTGTYVAPTKLTLREYLDLLAHVPDAPEVLVRHYGAYSVRRRARCRRAGILADTRTPAGILSASADPGPDWPALRARRQRWAELLLPEHDPRGASRAPP